jgi:hypothetical protein
MTAKRNVASVTSDIYDLLEPLAPDERLRAINAALTLLGTSLVASTPAATPSSPYPVGVAPRSIGNTAAEFFASKDPHSKIEELAVAARYRENENDARTHTKEELQEVFRAARRNFDARNFHRDMDNARVRGVFTRDKEITLAYYGQQYVDLLPDREAVKALRRPKRVKGKGRSVKQVKTPE